MKIILSSFVLNLVLLAPVLGQPPGTLDSSFPPLLFHDWIISPIHVQPDGKILLANAESIASAGFEEVPTPFRLDAVTGARDRTFNSAIGRYGVEGSACEGFYYALTQPDGRILVAGTHLRATNSTAGSGIVRLNSDGSWDHSFAAPASLNLFCGLGPPHLGPDGKIIFSLSAFQSVTGPGSLVRLKPDGSSDETFRVVLTALVPIAQGEPWGGQPFDGLAIHPDQSVTWAFPTDTGRLVLTRLQSNGSLDPNFNTHLVAQNVSDARWVNVRLLTDFQGRIVLATTEFLGTGEGRVGYEGRVWRFNPDGTPDSTFPTSLKTDGIIVGLAQQTDGKLILGGTFTTVAGVIRRGLARLNVDGTVDSSFDPGRWFGEATEQEVRTFALQPNGQIIAIAKFIDETALLIRVQGDQKPWFVPGSLNRTSPGEFQVLYTAPVNTTVVIEATSTLSPPNWQRIATQPIGAPGLFGFTETNTTLFSRRFYRLVQQ